MLQILFFVALFSGTADSEIDRHESAPIDVERAARDYRIQIYETFRLDRPEYDLRREAGDRLLEDFRAAGSPADKRQDVLDWFVDAAVLSRPDETETLPELPSLPAPQKGNVAQSRDDDPTVAPHIPAVDRLHIKVPAGPRSSGSQDVDFLGTPTPVEAKSAGYQGSGFTPPSKFLRSIQRALISSATEAAAAPTEQGADSADNSDRAPGTHDAEVPNTQDRSQDVDPFAPRNIDGDAPLFPALDEPTN